MSRAIITILLFLSVILLPYWIYLPAIVITLIFFRLFWEGIVLGFIIDTLYGYGSGLAHYQFSLYALILFLLLIPIRDNLRFNA